MKNESGKTVAILQPGYLPWSGFFEQMARADVFVCLDDVQFTKNDWRNRNRIKTQIGWQWLTVPVSFDFGQRINEVEINPIHPWKKQHLGALTAWYGRSRFFKEYFPEFETVLARSFTHLIELDMALIKWIMKKIGLERQIVYASHLGLKERDRELRLIEICRIVDAKIFYEGLSGKNYIDEALFSSHGIRVEYQNYPHPYYEQLWIREQGFISHLSMLDLVLNHGRESLAIVTGAQTVVPPPGMLWRSANDVEFR